jgi:hypothetical protein
MFAAGLRRLARHLPAANGRAAISKEHPTVTGVAKG